MNALIHPLLEKKTTLAVAICLAFILLAIAFLTPGSFESAFWTSIQSLAEKIPIAAGAAERSHFPSATALAYFAALIFGTGVGAMLPFTRFGKLNPRAFRGGLTARLVRCAGYALWFSHIFRHPPHLSEGQRYYHLLQLFFESRIALLVWSEAIYAMSVLITVCLVAEFAVFHKRSSAKS